MDYDSPLFIAAVKKVLRNFANKTDENKSTKSEQTYAKIEKELPLPTPQEFNISDSTIDRIKTPTAHETRHEWWKDFLEVAGIGVLILYTIFAAFQWFELNTQNINQATANTNSGITADQTLRKMQETINEMKGLVVAATAQATAANKIARETEAAARSARQSLEETKKEFRLDQRPRIVLSGEMMMDKDGKGTIPPAPPVEPIVGYPIYVNISFKNVGKSAAYNLAFHRHLLFGTQMNQFRMEPPDSEERLASGPTLEATESQTMTAVSAEDTFLNEDFFQTGYKAWDGSWPIRIFGRISYKDAFGTLYCLPYMFNLLQSGNWAILTPKNGKLCPVGIP
jgi:hypothetical protein